MELYSLLAHRRYPEQPTVTINIFFTEQDHYIQKHFSITDLKEATEQWQKKISALQRAIIIKIRIIAVLVPTQTRTNSV